MSNFPSKIKKLRIENGLTQKQIAESLNVSQNAVYNWENGKREPNLDMIKQIAKYFDFPLYLLLDDNFNLENVELEMKRARPYKSYEMEEPPKPFTAPLTNSGVHKYVAHTRLEITPEQIEINRIQNKILNDTENVTEEEAKFYNDYYTSEQHKSLFKYLMETAQENLKSLKRLQTAYEALNEDGQEKVAEHAEMIAKIPEYQKKSDEPSQE